MDKRERMHLFDLYPIAVDRKTTPSFLQMRLLGDYRLNLFKTNIVLSIKTKWEGRIRVYGRPGIKQARQDKIMLAFHWNRLVSPKWNQLTCRKILRINWVDYLYCQHRNLVRIIKNTEIKYCIVVKKLISRQISSFYFNNLEATWWTDRSYIVNVSFFSFLICNFKNKSRDSFIEKKKELNLEILKVT